MATPTPTPAELKKEDESPSASGVSAGQTRRSLYVYLPLNLQLDLDSYNMTSEEKSELIDSLSLQLKSLDTTEENEKPHKQTDDKYIQDYESKVANGEVSGDYSKNNFVKPAGALVQKRIDISNPFWKVEVVNAVNPANFWVRSYELLDCLEETTIELNKFYKEYHEKSPKLSFEDLESGGYYAVKTNFDSGKLWARCKIVEPCSKTLPVMALLVDSGTLMSLPAENFRPLSESFCVLPVMAYEAWLGGTADPEGTSKKPGTPELCLRFQQRVNGKSFQCVTITGDSGDFERVQVFLVDTSSEPDQWIHSEF